MNDGFKTQSVDFMFHSDYADAHIFLSFMNTKQVEKHGYFYF